MRAGKRPISKVTVSLRRPTEYTRWRPRIDRGVGFTTLVWGVFIVGVER